MSIICTFSFLFQADGKSSRHTITSTTRYQWSPPGVQGVVSTNLDLYLEPKAGRGRFKQGSHLTVFNLRVFPVSPSISPFPKGQVHKPQRCQGVGCPVVNLDWPSPSKKSHLPLSSHATQIHPPKTSAMGVKDARGKQSKEGLLLRSLVVLSGPSALSGHRALNSLRFELSLDSCSISCPALCLLSG